jgi:tetratricopeptide (TPR) repeat protein
MEWSYPNAVPHGLCYEIKKDPVPVLNPDQVEGDMNFWREYIDHLKNDPRFDDDIDAQRSFSKLRNTGGNIYKWRKMPAAAEKAYRQALELWPGNTETLNNFTDLLMKQGRTPELRDILGKALKADPNNGLLGMLLANCENQIALGKEIAGLEKQWNESSKDPELFQQLLVKYSAEGNREKADPLVILGASLFPTNSEVLRLIVNYYAIQSRVPEAVIYGKKLEKLAPGDADLKFGMAKFYMAIGNKLEFYRYLNDSVRLGGLPMREKISAEGMFQKIQGEPEFQSALRGPQKVQ